MATRCCWPPDSWAGLWPARSVSPTRAEQLVGRGQRLAPRPMPIEQQRHGDVLPRRQRGDEVERLEHEADRRAAVASSSASPSAGHVDVVDDDATGGRAEDAAEARQQRRLARAGRAEQHDQLARLGRAASRPSIGRTA